VRFDPDIVSAVDPVVSMARMVTLADVSRTLVWCLRHPKQTVFVLWDKWSGLRYPVTLPVTDLIGDAAVSFQRYEQFEVPTEVADWDIRLQDLFWLVQLVRNRRPRRILEFGTFTGLATLYLAKNSENDTEIVTLDWERFFDEFKPAPELRIGMRFLGTEWESKIRVVDGDLDHLDPGGLGTFDFIFVDADHRYESTKRDTHNALQMLADGGTIVWHDYQREVQGGGVVRCLNEYNARLGSITRIRGTHLAFWDKPPGTL